MPLPMWVRKRDGTILAFEPDKISRALFAASESLGRPNAFLARELADGVVHFLVAELDDATPSTSQIAEIIVKVVRELGQPAIAQAFADGACVRKQTGKEKSDETFKPALPAELTVPCTPSVSHETLVQSCLRAFALQAVYARDLVAAHRDGLLTLTGLEAPFELAGCIFAPSPDIHATFESIIEAGRLTGGLVALDGPEYALAMQPEAMPSYTRALSLGLRHTGLNAVVNLNCAIPPTWADDGVSGPLFIEQRSRLARNRLNELSEALLDQLILRPSSALSALRIDWHLCENDLGTDAEEQLVRVVRSAMAGAALTFVFDRASCPVALAEGMDRTHPGVLVTVGLNLPYLVDQVVGQTDAPKRLLQKLASLVRLALSAGVQKRDFLRRHASERSELRRSFLLDRGRLVIAPMGLENAVQRVLGQALYGASEAQDYARRLVERLRDVVNEDGRSRHLDVVLDSSLLGKPQGDPDVKSQLRLAAGLSHVADIGTIALYLSEASPPRPEVLVDWLRWIWKRSDITRLQLTPGGKSPCQLTFAS